MPVSPGCHTNVLALLLACSLKNSAHAGESCITAAWVEKGMGSGVCGPSLHSCEGCPSFLHNLYANRLVAGFLVPTAASPAERGAPAVPVALLALSLVLPDHLSPHVV